MAVTVTTNYTSKHLITAEYVENQKFNFEIYVPDGIDGFRTQAVVMINGAEIAISDVLDTPMPIEGMPGGYWNLIANIKPRNGLDALLEGNGIRGTQVYIKYNTYGTNTEEGIAEAQNVFLINRRYTPRITDFSVERYAFGEVVDDGINVLLTGKAIMTAENPAMAFRFHLRLYYAKGRTVDAESDYVDLGNIIGNPYVLQKVLDDITFPNTDDYAFMLWFGDDYESTVQYGQIFEAFANLHLSGKANGGVCMGGFSTSTNEQPKFECHYPAYFYGGIALGGASDYSADEVDTGVKWIDGKRIYRKVVQVGGISNGGTGNADLNTGALSGIISATGIGYTSGGIVRPLPFVNPNNTTDNASLTVRNYASAPSIRINVGGTGALVNAVVIVEYTKAGQDEVNNTLDNGKLDSMTIA